MAVQQQIVDLQQFCSAVKMPSFIQDAVLQASLNQQQGTCPNIDFTKLVLKDYGVRTSTVLVNEKQGQEGELVLGYISLYLDGVLLYGGLTAGYVSLIVSGKAPPYLCDESISAKSTMNGALSALELMYNNTCEFSGIITITWTNVEVSNVSCNIRNTMIGDISSLTKTDLDLIYNQLVNLKYPTSLLAYMSFVNGKTTKTQCIIKRDCDGEIVTDPQVAVNVIHTSSELQVCQQQQQAFQQE